MIKHLISVLLLLGLVGCQTPPRHQQITLGDWYNSQSQSKATLERQNTAHQHETTHQLSESERLQNQIKIYQQAIEGLQDAPNPELESQLTTGLLTLKIRAADQQHDLNPSDDAVFNHVSADLNAWLVNNPEHPQRDYFQYQLARIYDISGNNQAAVETLKALRPESQSRSNRQQEIDFRLAEKAFSQRNYDEALQLYTQVLGGQIPSDPPQALSIHSSKALYMRGWTALQLNQFAPAIRDFVTLLTSQDFKTQGTQMESDSFRGLRLAIHDAGGLTALPNLVNLEELEPIALPLYNQFIAFFKEQQRWLEVIETYELFQTHYPESAASLDMALNLLEFLEENDQKASLRQAKADFIERYSARSPEKSAEFSLELAQYYRAQSQTEQDQEKKKQAQQQSLGFYESFIDHFPRDQRIGSVKLAYGETLLEAGKKSESQAIFEALTTGPYAQQLQEKAAYLSIATLNEQIGESTESHRLLKKKEQLANAFILRYRDHQQTPKLLQWLMVHHFEREHYKQAIEYAMLAQDSYPELRHNALIVQSDSLFALKKWVEAAQSYEALIQSHPSPNPVWSDNRNKAYYSAARAAQPELAMDYYQKVYNSTTSDLAPGAMYEAAVMSQKIDLKITQQLLQRYIQDYPDHANQKDARLMLSKIFKDNQQWAKAAALLQPLVKSSSDETNRRTTQLEIADLYYKAEDFKQSKLLYEQLVQDSKAQGDTYETQALIQNRLIAVLQKQNQMSEAHRLMASYIKDNLDAPDATADTREKALEYSIVLAEKSAKAFEQTRITSDLQSSFKRKQQAMQTALEQYQTLQRFEQEEAAATANAGIGKLFAALGQSLMHAPIPKGLSELEQEEYMLIIEEQAFPLEEKAMDWHQKNVQLLHQGQWNAPIRSSLQELKTLLPARFDKSELIEGSITHVQ